MKKSMHLIFEREGLCQFFVVEGAKGDKEAWESVKRQHPEIGDFPPEPGDEYDLIDATVIQAPDDLRAS
jgi:hypothetical protein